MRSGSDPAGSVEGSRKLLDGLHLDDRLTRQLAFCLEIDKVKKIVRRNTLMDGSRREGDAEHQWHLAVMALVLAEHAAEPVDAARVIAMVLVHDLVEIDAGDAFVYDSVAREAAVGKEVAAAERIFGLLPPDQATWMRSLWEEFEAATTADARFAAALDRLQPMLQNASASGGGWAVHGITADRITEKAETIGPGSEVLLDVAHQVVAYVVETGAIAPGPTS